MLIKEVCRSIEVKPAEGFRDGDTLLTWASRVTGFPPDQIREVRARVSSIGVSTVGDSVRYEHTPGSATIEVAVPGGAIEP